MHIVPWHIIQAEKDTRENPPDTRISLVLDDSPPLGYRPKETPAEPTGSRGCEDISDYGKI